MEGDGSTSSPHDVNSYIIDHVPRATPYMSLLQDIMPQKVGTKSSKQHLSLLREMCIYSSAQSPSPEIFSALVTTMAACPDADVERKIVRTALHIVADMLYTDRRGVIDDGARQQLWVVLTDELDKYTGSRQAVGWRLAGQLCALLGFHRDLVERAEQELSSFRNLAKPSGWFKKNAKREYEEQLYTSAAKISALRRCGGGSSRCVSALVLASCSQCADIARHALAILAEHAKYSPMEIFTTLGKKARPIGNFQDTEEQLHTADTLCCIYILRIYEGVAMDEKSLVSPEAAHTCYMCIVHSMLDARLRVQLEAIRALTERNVAWRRKEDSEKIVDTLNVLELITATLQRALGNAAPLALKSVCRACIMLGRFVVNRPRSDTATIGAKSSSAALQSSDAFFGLLAPAPYAENVPSSTAQEVIRVGSKERFDTIRRLNDLMMDVSSAFQSKSAHVKCEALKAVLWLAPEVEAEDEDEAKSNVWSWIQRRLEESRSALSEELLGGVMRHAFGRMKETPFCSAPMLKLVLHMGEVFFRRGPSASLFGVLVQCWAMAATFGPIVAEPLLRSILNCLDMLTFPIDIPEEELPLDASVQSAEAASAVDNLRRYCYWCLGEYIHLWGQGFVPCQDVFTIVSGSNFEYSIEHSRTHGPVLLPTVVLRLQHGLWFEDYQTRVICAQALCKLAVRVSDTTIKAYIYNILHEAQYSHTEESVYQIPQPLVYSENRTISADTLELLHATATGPQFGLERVIWPTMIALDTQIPGGLGAGDGQILSLVDVQM